MYFPDVNLLTLDELAAEIAAWEADIAAGVTLTASATLRLRRLRERQDWEDTAMDKAAMFNGQ